jgi:hypothetical protein
VLNYVPADLPSPEWSSYGEGEGNMHSPKFEANAAVGTFMFLRCKIDQLLLPAFPASGGLIARDGTESFILERVEAIYYELLSATLEEQLWLERNGYRLLKPAADFRQQSFPLRA